MECRRGSRTSSQTRSGSCRDQGEARSGTSPSHGQTHPGTRAFGAQAKACSPPCKLGQTRTSTPSSNGNPRGSGQTG
jgi:hypothetical protein